MRETFLQIGETIVTNVSLATSLPHPILNLLITVKLNINNNNIIFLIY